MDTLHGSSVTTGGKWSTRRKPAMFGTAKLDNTLLISVGSLKKWFLKTIDIGAIC